MTKDETTAILAILKAAYPTFYQNMRVKDAESVVNVWHTMFAEDDPKIVTAAVQALIVTDVKGYPPHIGAVKEKIRLLTQPEEMSELEAWSLVTKAVTNTQWQHPERQFDKLPEIIRNALGSASTLVEWGKVDESAFNTVIQSNFLRTYRAKAARAKEYNALPANVKALISGMGDNTKLLED
jgi:hypothetical protein